MEPRTHLLVDPRWCGTPVALREGAATVELLTITEMAADERGLVHGGFVFGLADYAAMLAVNDPNVVLAAARVELTAPVRVGERLFATAEVVGGERRRRAVQCTVTGPSGPVMQGELDCVVLGCHVLDLPARR